MSTTVNLNGASYSVPQVGEPRGTWGSALSSYLIAISTGTLQRNGGNQALSADLNTGTFGFVVPYIKSNGSNLAQSGQVRLANNESITWRNAANGADITLKVNGSDVLEYNGSAIAAAGDVSALTTRVTTAEGEIDALQAADVTLQTNINNKLTRSSPLDNFKTLVDAPVSGFIAENAVGLFAHRTITAGSSKVSVSDGAGVAGNPTLDVVEANLNVASMTGSIPLASRVSGTLPIANGGTGQTGANAAFNALAPTQTTHTGKFLQTDGTNTSWVASSGGLAAVATTSTVALAVANTMYSCTSTGGFQITLPTIPALGAVIGVMDAGETCSATNYIRVAPATGQSIDGYPANDTLTLDYARASAVFYAAPGATSWKVQYQATSMVQGGQLPGSTTGSAIAAGFIGERISNSSSVLVAAPSTNVYGGDHSIVLTAGEWDISAQVSYNANGATVTYCDFFIGTVSGNNTTGKLSADNTGEALPPTSVANSMATVSNYAVRPTTSTTYYLKIRAGYTVATAQYTYRISARRVG